MKTKYASWFWYGRVEGAHGAWVPPDSLVPKLLYWIGYAVGRIVGVKLKL